MVDFAEALGPIIAALEEQKADLQEQIDGLEVKIAVLRGVVGGDALSIPTPAKKKPGRPKGVANKPLVAPRVLTKDQEALQAEAAQALKGLGGGTDPEKAKQIAGRFTPSARPQHSYGNNVRVPTRGEMSRMRKGEPREVPLTPNAPEDE